MDRRSFLWAFTLPLLFPNRAWERIGTMTRRHIPIGSDVELDAEIAAKGGGGGSLPSTATATFTTDPDTFVGEHVFDLGHASVISYSYTVSALVADGETWGLNPGEIAVAQAEHTHSLDNVSFSSMAGEIPANGAMAAVSASRAGGGCACARYLKLGADIVDSDFNVYSGPNHPRATVRIDIEYLT